MGKINLTQARAQNRVTHTSKATISIKVPVNVLSANLWLEKGVLATNGSLVERAVSILHAMNVRVLGPAEVREKLKLVKR